MKRREEQGNNRRARAARWTLDSNQWRQQWFLYNNQYANNNHLIHDLLQEVSYRYQHRGGGDGNGANGDALQMLLFNDDTKRKEKQHIGETSSSLLMIKSPPLSRKNQSGSSRGNSGTSPLIQTETDVVNAVERKHDTNLAIQMAHGGSLALTMYYLRAFGNCLEIAQEWHFPQMTYLHAAISLLMATLLMPHWFAKYVLYSVYRLTFGTLYPAYASYKAVRTKNVKEYVKWMMYWIVYAFFTCIETFTDIFLSWFPFYYEVKVILVLWLLSPATKGSSTLYRKFVHPMLTKREQEIDEYLNQAKERGYSAVLQLGSKSVNYATNVIMQTAIKGGGNLVQTLRRSYSLSDLSESGGDPQQNNTEETSVVDSMAHQMLAQQSPRMLRSRIHTPVGARTSSAPHNRHSTGMYFTEIDVTSAKAIEQFSPQQVRSTDDISSGYSSAEALSTSTGGGILSRTSSMSNASKTRFKGKRAEDKYMTSSYTTLPRSKKAERAVQSGFSSSPGGGRSARIRHDK